MSEAKGRPRTSSFPSLGRLFWGVVAGIVAVLLVGVQGLTVGLFGGYHGSLHWGSFLLHVVVLGPLPALLVFWLAIMFPVPEPFVVDLAIGMLATSLILVGAQLLGGLSSSNLTLIKFAVAAYGSYVVALYLWVYRTMRVSGKSGVPGVIHVCGELFVIARGNFGATQQPETAADGQSEVGPDSASQSQSREQP